MSHQKSVLTWNTHSARSDIAHSPHCPSCDMWFDLVISHPRAYGPRVRYHSVKSHVALGTVRTESDVASGWVRVSAINTLFRCDITPRCRTIIGACSGRMLHPNGCDFWNEGCDIPDVAPIWVQHLGCCPHWDVALERVRTRTHKEMFHPKIVKLSLAKYCNLRFCTHTNISIGPLLGESVRSHYISVQ